MKTSIKTIIALSLAALTFTSSNIYANPIKKPTRVSATAVSVSSIKKLYISGNVEVTLVQNKNAKVLFTNEGTTEAVVKKLGDNLYISSKENTSGAKVVLYVDDVYRIDAAEDASVNISGNLKLDYLQLYLKDNANIAINAHTKGLFSSLKDAAKLNLTGSTENYTVNMDKSARISIDHFKSAQTHMNTDVIISDRK